MSAGGLTTAWARGLVSGLLAGGVDHFFVSPGSRSTPLVLAVHELARASYTVIVDERSAGFAALGHARVSGRPSVVVSTSGSAGAHFFPAIIEAELAHIPLVVVTADRPIELQEAGAPQTIDQVRLFGTHVRKSFELGAPDASALDSLGAVAGRVVTASLRPLAGPVHVNARFRKPLEPTDEPALRVEQHPAPRLFCGHAAPSEEAVDFVLRELRSSARPCIVVGPLPYGSGSARAAAHAELLHALRRVATQLGVFVAAETTAGVAPSLDGSVGCLGPLLEAGVFEGELAPDLVLELGSTPVSSAYARFAAAGRCRRIVVGPAVVNDPQQRALAFVQSDAVPLLRTLATALPPATRSPEQAAFLGALSRVSSACHTELERAGDASALSEPAIARSVVRAQTEGCTLVVGNSLIVRDVDAFGADLLRPGVSVLHQRGACGIDGLLAGAIGARLATPPDRGVTLLYGDVSALHDLGSFVGLRDVRSPLAIVVVNNLGGRIFEALPIAAALGDKAAFERLYLTPPPSGMLEKLAPAFGARYLAASTLRSFDAALEEALRFAGPTLVEAFADPEHSRVARRTLRAALTRVGKEALRVE